jgi:UDP-N-acetylmuramate dehydrogenase
MITLPSIRGRIAHRAMLAPATWFRVGGPAEFLVRPADVDDLAALMAGLPLDLPVTVIGAASNIIVREAASTASSSASRAASATSRAMATA